MLPNNFRESCGRQSLEFIERRLMSELSVIMSDPEIAATLNVGYLIEAISLFMCQKVAIVLQVLLQLIEMDFEGRDCLNRLRARRDCSRPINLHNDVLVQLSEGRLHNDYMVVPTNFQLEYQEILRYEAWRQSLGIPLSQFATIHQLERPFAEEVTLVCPHLQIKASSSFDSPREASPTMCLICYSVHSLGLRLV